MRTLFLAAAAVAALSAAPAQASEGTFQPTAVASGFMARMMNSAETAMRAGTSFQYNNAGNYGDVAMPAAGRAVGVFGGRIAPSAFGYNMTTSQG
jgi:ABC-type sugar transport system substrate-binding protein